MPVAQNQPINPFKTLRLNWGCYYGCRPTLWNPSGLLFCSKNWRWMFGDESPVDTLVFSNYELCRIRRMWREEWRRRPLTQGEGVASLTSIKLGGSLVPFQSFGSLGFHNKEEEEELSFKISLYCIISKVLSCGVYINSPTASLLHIKSPMDWKTPKTKTLPLI